MSAAEARDRAVKEKEAVDQALEVIPVPLFVVCHGQ